VTYRELSVPGGVIVGSSRASFSAKLVGAARKLVRHRQPGEHLGDVLAGEGGGGDGEITTCLATATTMYATWVCVRLEKVEAAMAELGR
jgi:hypothetical protein